jgi:hypothetical protein
MESLPVEERFKLSGKAGWCSVPESFCIHLYNGSSWVITQLTVTIVLEREDGTVEWERKFQESALSIAPLSSSEVIVKPGERSGRFSWNIFDARGYKPD